MTGSRLPEARERAELVFRRLAEMDGDHPRRYKFSREAQALFVAWLTELETTLAAESVAPVMMAHLAKYRSLMPSLALLFALADGCEDEVPLRHAQQAAGWCEYLRRDAHRVYSAKLTPERNAAAQLAKRLRDGWKEREAGFSLRDVYHGNWAALNTPEEARAALGILEEAGWVRKGARSAQAMGRPTERWAINPRIYVPRMDGGAQ